MITENDMGNTNSLITTFTNKEKELTSDSDTFYRDYWTDGTEINQRSEQVRDEIIRRFFPQKLTGKRILEIGVGGEGGLIASLGRDNEVHGADVSDAAIRNCSRMGLSVIKANLDTECLPFDDASFDVVIALEVFEHFANPQFVIEEIRRLLTENGTLLISAPTPWCYHWPRLFYPWLFDEEHFTEFLMVNCFAAERVDNWFLQIPHNKDLAIPPKMKAWNSYWIAEKVSETDGMSFLRMGSCFWDKTNEYGIRTRPLEALDMFRRSFRADGNENAWLSMTHALLYRFLYHDVEEFTSMYNQLLNRINGIITAPVTCPYVLTLTKIVLEAERFGHMLVDEEILLHLKEMARGTPLLQNFQKDLCLAQ